MDEVLLKRAQQGDMAAFEKLMTPLEPLVWRLCWRYTGNTEDAKDCMQETMVKAWRSLSAYRGDAAIETWLYRVCTTCCLDFLRGRRKRAAESIEALGESGFDPPDAVPTPEETALRHDEHAALRQALADLPEDMRAPLVMSAMEGKCYADIAQALGIAVGTVKSRVSRARARLMEKISSDREQSAKPIVQSSDRGTNA